MNEKEANREAQNRARTERVRKFVQEADSKIAQAHEAAADTQAHEIEQLTAIVNIGKNIDQAQKRAQELQRYVVETHSGTH